MSFGRSPFHLGLKGSHKDHHHFGGVVLFLPQIQLLPPPFRRGRGIPEKGELGFDSSIKTSLLEETLKPFQLPLDWWVGW